MKTKRKVLIGLMALSLLGGVGGALALTRNQASLTGTTGAFDQAIYLNWEADQSSITLSDITTLAAGTPQYRYLTVAPKSTKTVAGTVTLSFTLAAGAADTHMKGLTVSVFETASLATDGTVAGLINEVVASPVLDEDHLTGSINITITATGSAHPTTKYYAIQVAWDGSNDSSHLSYVLGASLTISQAFSPAA